ncbi:hypothetical protein [Candidatus Magnetobacterium casense]|uniref:Uncharacterized protein n=1 Tax=Candidatus Magnetobacterium casense TaxID=1455061 RepID=A0ABS6S5J4_9BACT|nr:hypothetical protein [Candidatus Magnetobacterium casensis]MBV6343778.1 hypothetical protein [Candidatus Magnetobacterium casensis]
MTTIVPGKRKEPFVVYTDIEQLHCEPEEKELLQKRMLYTWRNKPFILVFRKRDTRFDTTGTLKVDRIIDVFSCPRGYELCGVLLPRKEKDK